MGSTSWTEARTAGLYGNSTAGMWKDERGLCTFGLHSSLPWQASSLARGRKDGDQEGFDVIRHGLALDYRALGKAWSCFVLHCAGPPRVALFNEARITPAVTCY